MLLLLAGIPHDQQADSKHKDVYAVADNLFDPGPGHPVDPYLGERPMLTPFDEDLCVGSKVVDRYEILSVLGRGSMGVVYKARHSLMGRTVALKMLRWQLLQDERSMKRFEREAKAASRMDHPNIIMVHDFGLTPSRQPYLVMDYARGITLYDVQKAEDHISAKRLVHIFSQVCDALYHAHMRSVIHRDLKPANIMLIRKDDDPDFVKVVDLGVAKIALGSDEEAEAITRTGEVCGSPVYLSPEQCKHEDMDARSDIYALGVVMYEMLTGRAPLMGETVYDTMYMHVHEAPAPFAAMRPDLIIPRALEQIIFKCLEKNPLNRYQTMLELRQALQEVLKVPEAAGQAMPPQLKVSQPLNCDLAGFSQAAAADAWLSGAGNVPKRPDGLARTYQPGEVPAQKPGLLAAFPKISPVTSAIVSAVVAVAGTLVFVNFVGEINKAHQTGSKLGSEQAPEQGSEPLPSVVSSHIGSGSTVGGSEAAISHHSSPRGTGKPGANFKVQVVSSGASAQSSARPADRARTPATVIEPEAGRRTTAGGGKAAVKTAALPAKHIEATPSGKEPANNKPGGSASSFLSLFFPGQQSPAIPAPTVEGHKNVTRAPREPKTQPAGSVQSSLPVTGNSQEAELPAATAVKEEAPPASAHSPCREAVVLNNAGVETLRSNPDVSIEKFQQALKLEPGYQKARQNLTRAYHNYAINLQQGGRFAEAEHYYKQALSMMEKSLGRNSPETMTTISNYASLLRQVHRDAEAAKLEAQ